MPAKKTPSTPEVTKPTRSKGGKKARLQLLHFMMKKMMILLLRKDLALQLSALQVITVLLQDKAASSLMKKR